MNLEVSRDPVDPEKIKQEIDDVFVFNPPISLNHANSCQKIQNACKALAQVISDEVPEGKEQTICINGLLSVALFARHGITRKQVVIVAMTPPPPQEMTQGMLLQESAPVASTGENI